jgi:hypothetical protein
LINLKVKNCLQKTLLPNATRTVTSWAAVHAAEGGHLDILQWLRQGNAPSVEVLGAERCFMEAESCATAAKHGHFEIVRWMREHDFPWAGLSLAGVRSFTWTILLA